MGEYSGSTFAPMPTGASLTTEQISVTISNHHEILIRMDERSKNYVTKDDLSDLEGRLSDKISNMYKWCIGSIFIAILAQIAATIVLSAKEVPVKVFVVSESQIKNMPGVPLSATPVLENKK